MMNRSSKALKLVSLRLSIGLWMLVGFCSSAARADQLVMKNGDRVGGSIIKQDGKAITIKSDSFGVITAPWSQVASIQSQQSLNVVLKDGRALLGAVSTSEGKIRVTARDTAVDVTPGDITAIRNSDEQKAYDRLVNPGLFDLWSGSATVGWAGTNGNAKTLTFTTAVNAARTTNTDKTSLYFNLIKASALVNGISASTAQAVRGGLAYDHNLSSRLFLNAFNDYEYDRFQNLDLRFVVGGGLGFHAVKTERSSLDLLAGADFNHSSFSTPLTRNEVEAYWGDEYTLKLTGPSSLIQSFRVFNNLSDVGAYRMNADLGVSTKLNRWLSWNLALSDRFLSNPVPGRKTNDWLYTTGLGLNFGK